MKICPGSQAVPCGWAGQTDTYDEANGFLQFCKCT